MKKLTAAPDRSGAAVQTFKKLILSLTEFSSEAEKRDLYSFEAVLRALAPIG